jgi:hypothetical protein
MENFGIFMAIWNILRPFGIFYGHLVDFVVFCYIFGMLYQEKSGNPDRQSLTHQLEFKKTETRCTS